MDAQLYHRCSTFFRLRPTVHLFTFALVQLIASVQVVADEPEKNSPKNASSKTPEAVYVAVEKANLYAGPSSDFYPTGMAKRGTVLDVYLRTPSGWLGVRPPQGSFSWVPASQAYLLPGGRVIEITDENAVSWIGTELGSAKQYRWQVQLKVGEQLSVLGEATIKNEADDREALWYKVSPPAGEFRWIEQAAVSKTAPPVKSTTSSSESQVANNTSASPTSADEPEKAEPKTAPPLQAAVQTVSFESPSTKQPTQPATIPKKPIASQRSNASRKHTSPESQWDGWYAFEMSEGGVRTPFLDKLSGRDRGQSASTHKGPVAQHDPLIHDPFSLTMANEPQQPTAQELNSVAKKQREWRDPRSLREARLAGSPTTGSTSIESPFESSKDSRSAALPSILMASSDGAQNVTAGGVVNTAGYERESQASSSPPNSVVANARAAVNWYGLSEGSSAATSQSGTSLNVVTSAADVGELQLALNSAVASTTGPWNLAPLAERAQYLIEHGPSAIERGQARLLLERIEAFQNVSARTQQISGASLGSNPVQSTSFNAATQNVALPNSPQSSAGKYDATGWLVPVHAAGPDQPTHALTNDTGDIVAYVSPIAGLNLDRYRNQAVGITGLRGYLPQLQAAHIQAQRVSRVR